MNREERVVKYINSADELVFNGKRYCENDFYNDVEDLAKENKILRENAEHNDKVVDKFSWENQKLKKQLEEYKRLGFEHLNDKCNKLENQQKEFIDYLENEKNIYPYDISDYTYEDIINTILSKYEEIIG